MKKLSFTRLITISIFLLVILTYRHYASTIEIIKINPSSLSFTGSISTKDNVSNPQLVQLFKKISKESILIGVDPNTNDWKGGIASYNLDMKKYVDLDYYAIVKINWDKNFGYGIRSLNKDSVVKITANNVPIWSIKCLEVDSLSNSYFAFYESEIISSFFIDKSSVNFEIIVPESSIFAISSIEIKIVKLSQKISGFCYSPFRDGQNPNNKTYPTSEQIGEDIMDLRNRCNAIHTYSCTDSLDFIASKAAEQNLPVFAGAWLSNYDEFTDYENDSIRMREIDALVHTANNNPNVFAVCVGSEVILRGNMNSDKIISYINEVRRRVNPNVQIAYADTYSELLAHPEIIDSIDIIFFNSYAFWEGIDIELAIPHLKDTYNKIRIKYPNKKIIISESGWPSAGNSIGHAVPTIENQRRFLNEFLTWTCGNNIDFFYFESYDETWKAQYEGGQGKSWGISYSDRTGKHPNQTLLYCPEPDTSVTGDIRIVNIKDLITTNISIMPVIVEFTGKYQDTSEYKIHITGNHESIVDIVSFGKRERIYYDAKLNSGLNIIRISCEGDNDTLSKEVRVYYDSLYRFYGRELAFLTTGNSLLVSDTKEQTALGRVFLPFEDGNQIRTIYELNQDTIIVVGSGGISLLNTLTSTVIDSFAIKTSSYAALDTTMGALYFATFDSLNGIGGVELSIPKLEVIRTFSLDSLTLRFSDFNNKFLRFTVNDSLLLIGHSSYAALFNRNDLEFINEYKCGEDRYLDYLLFSPTKPQFYATNASWGYGRIIKWDFEIDSTDTYALRSNFARDLAFSSSGDTLFSMCSGSFIGMGGKLEARNEYDLSADPIWQKREPFTGDLNINNNIFCALAKRHDFGNDSIYFGLGITEFDPRTGNKMSDFEIGYDNVKLFKYGFKELAVTDLLVVHASPPIPGTVIYFGSESQGRIILLTNNPNPFSQYTNLNFIIRKDESLDIVIYNMFGEKVKILVDDIYFPKGFNSVVWDGFDLNNMQVPSGTYFYCIETPQELKCGKIILVK